MVYAQYYYFYSYVPVYPTNSIVYEHYWSNPLDTCGNTYFHSVTISNTLFLTDSVYNGNGSDSSDGFSVYSYDYTCVNSEPYIDTCHTIEKIIYLIVYILNQIDHFKFTNIQSLKSISKRINDQIKSIEIKDDLANHIIENGFGDNEYLTNLKQVKFIIKTDRYYCYRIRDKTMSFLSPTNYEIKYKSNDVGSFEVHLKNESIYTKLKKVKLSKTKLIEISLVNDTLEKANNLKSFEFSLNTAFYYYVESDHYDEDEEHNTNEMYKNEIPRFENLFVNGIHCKNLKTLSIRDPRVFNFVYYYSYLSHPTYNNVVSPNYSYFKTTVLPNILQSKFQNISKLCLAGKTIPIGFFKFLSTDKILKLKLESVFFISMNTSCNENHFLELIDYLNENQKLKQLSIKSNYLYDYENSLSSTLKTHKSLTKLDISGNNLNLVSIFDSIIYKSPQFTKITISDTNILPYDYLINNQKQLLSYDSDFNNLQIK